jgi:hypothetical protein
MDPVLCDAMDHTSRHDNIPTPNEGPFAVLNKSGVYTSQVHSLSPLIIIPDASGSQCSAHEEAELLAPSWSLNIIMTVQFVFILTATVLSIYDYFCPRS